MGGAMGNSVMPSGAPYLQQRGKPVWID
jgi:hypothetical protein